MMWRIYSDVESDVKSTDPPEIRERKETNARTRATMASLRQRMDQATMNKVNVSIHLTILITQLTRACEWSGSEAGPKVG